MARIFISYAAEDRVVAEEVVGWLRSAGHRPFLAHDLRDGIVVGEDWEQRLYAELRRGDAVVGVVTSSFLVSVWCLAEVAIARAVGCRLMLLSAEAGVVHPLMQRLQSVDYLVDPQQARERVLQAMGPKEEGRWREGENPFPGLEPFTVALSRVFFGRVVEAREVSSRLRAMGSAGGILAVVGSSGCGKSSLLNAAVVPLFASDAEWLTVPSVVPGTNPVLELARALTATADVLELGWSVGEVRSRLEAGADGLHQVVEDLMVASSGPYRRRLLVSIDQAEELFTRTPPHTRDRFAQLVRECLNGPVRVVMTMRSEFLDDLRGLSALTGERIEAHVLAPLDREMLREVIEGPAKVARLELDEGLAAVLVTDTDSGDALPLLAFTLRQLAEGLPHGGRLTLARYHEIGGVHGGLTQRADTVLAEARRASGLSEREIVGGLTRLVTVDDNGRRARRRIRLTGLVQPLRIALQVFLEARLLLSDIDDEGQVWLTVTHEALLTGWRPLDTATTEILIALRAARIVEQAAAEWASSDRSEHYLWDAQRLTATQNVLGIAENHDGTPDTAAVVEIDDEAWAFLGASARRVRVVQQRERRRRTRTLTALSTLLVLALIATGIALWQQQRASEAQRRAIARGLVAQAERIRDHDPRGALQLGVAAEALDTSPQIQSSLLQTLTSTPPFRTLLGHTGTVWTVAFAPDGRTLATASADRTVRLWDLANRDRPHQLGSPLTGHTNAVNGVAFAPDGRTECGHLIWPRRGLVSA